MKQGKTGQGRKKQEKIDQEGTKKDKIEGKHGGAREVQGCPRVFLGNSDPRRGKRTVGEESGS